MQVKIVSWNIEGRLSPYATDGRGAPEHIINELRRLDADIVFLAESSDGDDIDPQTRSAIDELGYSSMRVTYDDRGSREVSAVAKPAMMLLWRRCDVRGRQVRFADIRTMIAAEVIDPQSGDALLLIGTHLDDRTEENRLAQVRSIAEYIQHHAGPVLMMGDFNAMHGSDWRARVLRGKLFRYLIRLLPHTAGELLTRLSGMASGSTLAYLESATPLRDVDSRHRATTTPKLRSQLWLPSVRVVQIDHMYTSPEIVVKDFSIHADGGSDHRALSATISLMSFHP